MLYLTTPCGFLPGSPALLMYLSFMVTTVLNPNIDLNKVKWAIPDCISGWVLRE